MKYFKIQYLLLDLVITAIVFNLISTGVFPYDKDKSFVVKSPAYNRVDIKLKATSTVNSTGITIDGIDIDNYIDKKEVLNYINKKEVLSKKEILKKQIEELAEKPEEKMYEYIKITGSCGPYYNGVCLSIRSTPTINGDIIYKPRNGVVLKVKNKININGVDWYKISFDEWLLYPERLTTQAYIKADTVVPFFDIGTATHATTSRQSIVVDLSTQSLSAYEGKNLFLKSKVSTGLRSTPTATGTFTIFKKTPTRYMQGPVPDVGGGYYDLPGVPWNMYFTADGAAIHGAYWHESFGSRYSHGCVNLPPTIAQKLYKWTKVGTKVTIVE